MAENAKSSTAKQKKTRKKSATNKRKQSKTKTSSSTTPTKGKAQKSVAQKAPSSRASKAASSQTSAKKPVAAAPRPRSKKTAAEQPKGILGRAVNILRDPEAFRAFQQSLPSWTDEAGAFALILLGLLTFSAMLNPAGDFAAPIANALKTAFGVGGFVIAFLVTCVGAFLLLPKAGLQVRLSWNRVLAVELLFLTLQGLFHFLAFAEEPRALAREGGGGGYVGWAISSLMASLVGEWVAIGILGFSSVVTLGIFLGVRRHDIRAAILGMSEVLAAIATQLRPDPAEVDDVPVPPQQERKKAGGLPLIPKPPHQSPKIDDVPLSQQNQAASGASSVEQQLSPAQTPQAPTRHPDTPPQSAMESSVIEIQATETKKKVKQTAPRPKPKPTAPQGRAGQGAAPDQSPKARGRKTAPVIDNNTKTKEKDTNLSSPVVKSMPDTDTIEKATKAEQTEAKSQSDKTPADGSKSASSSMMEKESPMQEDKTSTPNVEEHEGGRNGFVEDENQNTARRGSIPINVNGRTINAEMNNAHDNEDDGDDTSDVNEVQTIVINGQVVEVPSTFPNTKKKQKKRSRTSQSRSVDGRREFIVDGFKTKTKIGRRSKILPPLELLEYSELKLPSNEEVNHKARLIEDTMLEFDIDADVIDVRVGPSITQYAVSPIKEVVDEDGERHVIRTRVSKIAALSSDLALALSTKTLRIEAPVPGHSYVGIEVPNEEPSVVSLRSVLEAEEYYNERKKPLAVPLGRDVSGDPVVIDLATMPHMLVAGTTGSGKSVGLRSMIASLVMSNGPDTLRMIVLDPKIVEFTQFNGLPHLIGPVETDAERIIGVLRWATREMDRRYQLLEQEKARNIEAYNAILGRRRKDEHMPYIVIIIDEIGDLMMLRPDETEKTLTRLAQKARAAGMHMVVATQRPSVDVITGLIKANFPARISYAVAAGVDSRVILDHTGAEALIGRGDMLFLGPDAAGPKRLQGCFVSDEEIEGVVGYWKEWHEDQLEAGKMEEPGIPPWEQAITRLESLSDLDPLLEEAVNLVVSEGQASASLIQRKLGIGYPRAAHLMDSLHELSIVGSPQAGGKTRQVLVKSVDEARRMVQNNRRKQRY